MVLIILELILKSAISLPLTSRPQFSISFSLSFSYFFIYSFECIPYLPFHFFPISCSSLSSFFPHSSFASFSSTFTSSPSSQVCAPILAPQQNARPTEEEEEETRKETMEALQKVVNYKITAANPKTVPNQPGAATYINYTPSQQGAQYNRF